MTRSLATHCKRGHEYTAENSYVNAGGHRECHKCRRAAHRRDYVADPARACAITREWYARRTPEERAALVKAHAKARKARKARATSFT